MLNPLRRSYVKLEKTPNHEPAPSGQGKATAQSSPTRAFARAGLPERESPRHSAHAGTSPPRGRGLSLSNFFHKKKTEGTSTSQQGAQASKAKLQRQDVQTPIDHFNGLLRKFVASGFDQDTKRLLIGLLSTGELDAFQSKMAEAMEIAPNTEVADLMESVVQAAKLLGGDDLMHMNVFKL